MTTHQRSVAAPDLTGVSSGSSSPVSETGCQRAPVKRPPGSTDAAPRAPAQALQRFTKALLPSGVMLPGFVGRRTVEDRQILAHAARWGAVDDGIEIPTASSFAGG